MKIQIPINRRSYSFEVKYKANCVTIVSPHRGNEEDEFVRAARAIVSRDCGTVVGVVREGVYLKLYTSPHAKSDRDDSPGSC